jgi:hypothetical protein
MTLSKPNYLPSRLFSVVPSNTRFAAINSDRNKSDANINVVIHILLAKWTRHITPLLVGGGGLWVLFTIVNGSRYTEPGNVVVYDVARIANYFKLFPKDVNEYNYLALNSAQRYPVDFTDHFQQFFI